MKKLLEIDKKKNKLPHAHGFAGVEAPRKAKTFKFIGFCNLTESGRAGPSGHPLARGLRKIKRIKRIKE